MTSGAWHGWKCPVFRNLPPPCYNALPWPAVADHVTRLMRTGCSWAKFYMRSEVFTAVEKRILVFWIVLTGGYQRSGRTYLLNWRQRQPTASLPRRPKSNIRYCKVIRTSRSSGHHSCFVRYSGNSSLNLSPETDYPVWGFNVVSSVPPAKCRDSTLP
jgi:hypothetical protein